MRRVHSKLRTLAVAKRCFSTADPFQGRMRQLVLKSGGAIEDDLFVTKPGCLLLARSELTPAAAPLLESMNIDTARPSYEQFAEFNSRITYLAFRNKKESSEAYNHKMARELQHLSVFGPMNATFLLAGIALETSLELIAHHEANIARLTSSKTKAMSHPLFRVQGNAEERAAQKAAIRKLIATRDATGPLVPSSPNSVEFTNMQMAGSKATALTFTMNIKDYHKLFMGRLQSHGNEQEVMEICGEMCRQLHAVFPLVVRSPQEYNAKFSNADKYKS